MHGNINANTLLYCLNMENIIECRHLTHYYGKRLIYKDLSFDVPRGRILGLLGKNGTGKTTTINILNGYLKPREGECRIFGETIQKIAPEKRRDIGLLLEGHVQYSFMTITQIERFYSAFYPRWRKEAYYELMSLLKVTPGQHIARMSCGQRSQVALGLILAQDPELLILDDFSLGLDPGYRRLFVEYLKEYAVTGKKSVFLTSHIIQDMERLIDDCIIMDYGHIAVQMPVKQLMHDIHAYRYNVPECYRHAEIEGFFTPSRIRNSIEMYSLLPVDDARHRLADAGIPLSDLQIVQPDNLEDAFIGITGKY